MTLGVSRLPCKYVPFKSSIYRKSLFVRFSNISFCNFVRFSNISRKTTFFSFCILMIHMILVIRRKQMHSTNYYGPFWSKRNLTAYFISDRIKIEKGTTDKRLVQRYMFTFMIKNLLNFWLSFHKLVNADISRILGLYRYFLFGRYLA